MRVNVDDDVLGDSRFKKLGQRLDVNWAEALGRCILVWFHAYRLRSSRVRVDDVNANAEIVDFHLAMIGSGLAEPTADADYVRLRGVDKRVVWLIQQDEKRAAARAAKERAANKRRRTPEDLPRDIPRDVPRDPPRDFPGDVPTSASASASPPSDPVAGALRTLRRPPLPAEARQRQAEFRKVVAASGLDIELPRIDDDDGGVS